VGAYNIVQANVDCPNCHQAVTKNVQFKYGDCYLHTYALGDRLDWGGNDEGHAGVGRVRVLAMPEPCPDCNFFGDEYYDVVIEHDIISGVLPLPEGTSPNYFYVVDED
jgi:hypothetical protein